MEESIGQYLLPRIQIQIQIQTDRGVLTPKEKGWRLLGKMTSQVNCYEQSHQVRGQRGIRAVFLGFILNHLSPQLSRLTHRLL